MQHNNDFNELYETWIATQSGDDPVLFFNDHEIRLGVLEEKIARYTAHLRRHGVTPGTGVGFSLSNSPNVFALFVALWRLGAYAVPLFPMIPDPMKVGIFSMARIRLAVTESPRIDTLRAEAEKQRAGFTIAAIDGTTDGGFAETVPTSDQDVLLSAAPDMPALVAASSGTTGMPKIVMMNRRNIGSAITCSTSMVPTPEGPGKTPWRSTIAFPLSTSGMLVCMGLLFNGVQLVFSDNPSPAVFLERTERWEAQLLSAPPAYFETLCRLPDPGPRLPETVRGIMTGMDFLSPSLLQRLGKRFPRLRYCSIGYGLVETSTIFMVHKMDIEHGDTEDTALFELTEGSYHEISICDENGKSVPEGTQGELRVRGNSVVDAYAGNPEATKESFVDGWFRTGDIARQTGAGTIELLGRNKYLIKRGGKSVSPLMVQNCINAVSGVGDSAVAGVPHELYGQMIWAFVVPENGTDGLEKGIMKACRESLPNYMLPDAIRFLSALPRTSGAGKLNTEELLQRAREELAALKEETDG